MNATKVYYDVTTPIDPNGINTTMMEISSTDWSRTDNLYPNTPGLKWTDSNGNNYRTYIITFDARDFVNKELFLYYAKDIQPVGTSTWIRVDIIRTRVSDDNWVNMADGTPNTTVIEVNSSNQPVDINGNVVSNVMLEYKYFCWLVGFNVPSNAFNLYNLFLRIIAEKESLTIS